MSKIIMALAGFFFFVSAQAVPNLGDTDPRNDDDSVSKIELDAYCMDRTIFNGFINEWEEQPLMTARTIVRYKGHDIKGQMIMFVHPKTFKYTQAIRFDDKWCIVNIGTRLRPIKDRDNDR